MLALLGAAACAPSPPAARLDLTVLRPADTLQFIVPFRVRGCSDSPGAILEGDDGATGVLLLLRPGDAAEPGMYDIRAPVESAVARHARVAVRYETGGVSRSLALDHGTARLDTVGGWWSGELEGGGIEVAGGTRPEIRAQFSGVAPPADSTHCGAKS